jgi:hypothetical protein
VHNINKERGGLMESTSHAIVPDIIAVTSGD